MLAIADELADGPFVYRYRAQRTDDGIGGEDEGTFTVCSFWLVSALVKIGELDWARTNCEKLLGAALVRLACTVKSSIRRPHVTSETSPRP